MELSAPCRRARRPRRDRRRGAGAVGRVAARGARRGRRRAGEGSNRVRRLGHRRRDRSQLLPLGGDHRGDRGARWRCSRPSRRSTASARWATSPRCPRRRWRTWSRSATHHERAGYDSELVVGADLCREYLAFSWPDWEAEVAALLHERRGGWADAMQTVRHLAARARDAGARIEEGVEVTGFELGADGVEALLTSARPARVRGARRGAGPVGGAAVGDARPRARVRGARRTERRAQAAGLLPEGAGGRVRAARRWLARRAPGSSRPSSTSTRPARCARIATAACSSTEPWGIYFRIGRTRHGITGGGLPVELADPALDPYGPDNPDHAAEPEFAEFFTSGLATALPPLPRRLGHGWRSTPAGGIVSHTPDNYPICDWVAPNAYAIVDSGHGFKMLALGSTGRRRRARRRRPADGPVPLRPLRAGGYPHRLKRPVSLDVAHQSRLELRR